MMDIYSNGRCAGNGASCICLQWWCTTGHCLPYCTHSGVLQTTIPASI